MPYSKKLKTYITILNANRSITNRQIVKLFLTVISLSIVKPVHFPERNEATQT